jgi:Zn-finger nucleic acid-binding protein
MAKRAEPPIEVICPCCQAKLKIDTQLAVVLAHVVPPKAGPDVDLSDAARLLREQAERREDKFRQSWDAEQKKEDVLTRKFEEALKKAKTEPIEKPIRDFDID